MQHRGMDGWTEGVKDSHTEMEVSRKATEERELVSRQRKRRRGGRGERRERTKHENTEMKN